MSILPSSGRHSGSFYLQSREFPAGLSGRSCRKHPQTNILPDTRDPVRFGAGGLREKNALGGPLGRGSKAEPPLCGGREERGTDYVAVAAY